MILLIAESLHKICAQLLETALYNYTRFMILAHVNVFVSEKEKIRLLPLMYP